MMMIYDYVFDMHDDSLLARKPNYLSSASELAGEKFFSPRFIPILVSFRIAKLRAQMRAQNGAPELVPRLNELSASLVLDPKS